MRPELGFTSMVGHPTIDQSMARKHDAGGDLGHFWDLLRVNVIDTSGDRVPALGEGRRLRPARRFFAP
ncbi:hypothetical protein MPL3365_170081 [Mesorhizobium plurifarium]|uniref:Uncharacterized protein n=1 Tax=Mesorhizobium plurifarium TaxID=69974 RepID=A0A090GTC7_MESPL|nr:hypothetical protein MPL3365_170081 [Mesorhizobium plurifarium]